MTRTRRSPAQLAVAIAPVLIAVLWVAGVASFRGHELGQTEWLALLATAFTLNMLQRRLVRPRPMPPLPPGANPAVLALLAGLILGVLATALGGAIEFAAPPTTLDAKPWALRASWHGACAFGASYCTFLGRMWQSLGKPRPPAARPPG